MTRNIQRIEKKKLVKRSPNPNDKRSIKLFLSQRGSILTNSINLEISVSLDKILDKYDLKISNQIKNNLENLSWDIYLHRQNLK
jgi:DNA-binding MarR family transcriptional regulator